MLPLTFGDGVLLGFAHRQFECACRPIRQRRAEVRARDRSRQEERRTRSGRRFRSRRHPSPEWCPSRISATAELKGGDDDFQDYYCPSIEWNWGDGTVSEATNDCEPYEARVSQIKRRYTQSAHLQAPRRVSHRLPAEAPRQGADLADHARQAAWRGILTARAASSTIGAHIFRRIWRATQSDTRKSAPLVASAMSVAEGMAALAGCE